MTTTKEISREEREIRSRSKIRTTTLLLLLVISTACGSNENILKSGKETPAQSNTESKITPVAEDLEAMRTAGFSFIYILRRKDGGKIDAEDRSVIKLNTAEANRRVAADEGRAFIIGTNFQIPANNLIALYDRFAVENYSQPSAPAANTNANSKK